MNYVDGMTKDTVTDSPQNATTPARSAPRGVADILGVTALMTMLRRRMVLVSIVAAAAAIITFAVLMFRTPTYESTALLILNPRQEALTAGAAGAQQLQAEIDSEIELLRSPALMNDLAAALGLQNPGGEASAAHSGDLTTNLSNAIAINRRGSTFVLEITASSTSAERAQLIANTYADVYIASQLNGGVGAAQAANSLLSRRLAELREDMQAKQGEVDAYRAENSLDSNDSPATEDQIGALQGQIQQAQAELGEREARNRQFQEMRSSGVAADAIAASFNSDTLRALTDRLTDISRRQADLEARYLPTHPAVQAVRVEHRDVEAQIERELQRMGGVFSQDLSQARARLQALQGSMRSAGGANTPSRTASSERLQELERQASHSREIYESYLERSQESADQGALGGARARLLSYASLPSAPASPQLRMALALALAAGLLFGIGAGVSVELFDHSVKNAEDLEAKVGCPAIASIPTISKRMMRQMPPAERHPSGYLVGRPMSAFTEALRVLRTVIVYSKLDFSVKVVAVTSALPNEGKTTISMCLARVAAMSGQRVCVVDCDLRKQSINDVIDVETDVGILQVLAGEAPWRSAIVRDPNSDAHVLPVASSGFTPRDVFGSDAMSRLIADLRAHYDLVVLDCAPILAVAETRILVGQADTTVLVARAGRTPIGAMRSAVEHTESAGGKVLGVALNYVLPRWQSYADSIYFDESKSYYSMS